MEAQIVNIQVFGRTLKLTCPADEVDSLNAAAKNLDERLNELRRKTQIMNSDQLIITIALNIAYELEKEKSKNSVLNEDFTKRLKNIQNVLNSVLNNSNQ